MTILIKSAAQFQGVVLVRHINRHAKCIIAIVLFIMINIFERYRYAPISENLSAFISLQ